MLMENGTRDLTDYKALARGIAKNELIVVDPNGGRVEGTVIDTIAGLFKLIEDAGRKIGNLERRLTEDGHADSHPQGKDITWLIEEWKRGTNKPHAKAGANRVKLVKARLKDKFPMRLEEGADPEPTLELAVIGLCAYPYREFAERKRVGTPSQKDDDFDAALKDEKHVESLSRYGWKAQKAGYTIEAGWPEEEK